MEHIQIPEHDHIVCASCRRLFPRSRHMAREGQRTCPACSRPPACRGGYEPMMQIEVGEHQRLLQLYYAVFEHDMAPCERTAGTVRTAMQRCNRYFEGGATCH